jgi:hypothetical protein
MNKATSRNPALSRCALAIPSLSLFILAACGGPRETHEEIIREGLLSIVDSLGKPCEQVVDHELSSNTSYTVRCKSGDTYAISVTPEGRIHVK